MKRIVLVSLLLAVLGFMGCSSTDSKSGSAVSVKGTALSEELKGGVLLTSFYTAVEYNDIVVKDKDGNVIFEDDFSTRKDDWEAYEEWKVADGKVQMLDSMMFDSRYAIYNSDWEAATIIVTGARVEGDEGICLGFGAKGEEDFFQFNVGGWASTKTALQKYGEENGGIIAEATDEKFNSIPVGEEVELKVELNGKNVKCYLDNELVIDHNIK